MRDFNLQMALWSMGCYATGVILGIYARGAWRNASGEIAFIETGCETYAPLTKKEWDKMPDKSLGYECRIRYLGGGRYFIRFFDPTGGRGINWGWNNANTSIVLYPNGIQRVVYK